MDPQIVAALIGAVAIIIAAIITRGVWPPVDYSKAWFLVFWILANIVATVVWWSILNPANKIALEVPAPNFLAGIISGIVAGVLQWLVLRNRFPNSSIWILASALGWATGGALISFLPAHPLVNNILGGLITGTLEWIILNQYYKNSAWWIVADILDWVAGWYAGELLGWSFDAISGAIVGIASSFATGLTFVLILKRISSNLKALEAVLKVDFIKTLLRVGCIL